VVDREADHRVDLIVRGQLVGLGPVRRDLAALYQRWFNDLRVTRTLAWSYRPLSREAAESFLDAAFPLAGTDVSFVVYELTTLKPIGGVSLNDVDRARGTADFALVIGEPDAWGKGCGTEATRLTLAYAFDVLGLYNVHLVVYANNPRGVRAYERAGFRRIGVRRGAHRLGRERFDEIHMDAVADDFPPSDLHALLHPADEPPDATEPDE